MYEVKKKRKEKKEIKIGLLLTQCFLRVHTVMISDSDLI